MNPTRLLNMVGTLTVVVDDPTDRDEFNNPQEKATERTVRCWVEQLRADEDTDSTDQLTGRWRLVLEPTAGATGWDKLEVDGMEFSIDGPPWPARNPRTGLLTHIEATGVRIQ